MIKSFRKHDQEIG